MDQSEKPPAVGEVHEVVDAFTYEVALLYFRMTTAATELLGQGKHSSGRRSILRSIDADGAQTVPAMARVRSVSRQHVQQLVDQLKSDGLVRAAPNPAHRRSKLITLTADGRRFLQRMKQREVVLFDLLAAEISPGEFRQATELVRTLRQRLEDVDWDDVRR